MLGLAVVGGVGGGGGEGSGFEGVEDRCMSASGLETGGERVLDRGSVTPSCCCIQLGLWRAAEPHYGGGGGGGGWGAGVCVVPVGNQIVAKIVPLSSIRMYSKHEPPAPSYTAEKGGVV